MGGKRNIFGLFGPVSTLFCPSCFGSKNDQTRAMLCDVATKTPPVLNYDQNGPGVCLGGMVRGHLPLSIFTPKLNRKRSPPRITPLPIPILPPPRQSQSFWKHGTTSTPRKRCELSSPFGLDIAPTRALIPIDGPPRKELFRGSVVRAAG